MICLYYAVFTVATIVVCHGRNVDLTRKPYSTGQDVVQATIDRIDSQCIFPNNKLFMLRSALVQSNYGDDTKTFRPGYYGGLWQVDESMFNATSSCSGSLTYLCQEIETVFNIRWSTARWNDLLKPIYSALAVQLYMQYRHVSSIPGSITAQARLWTTLFNKPTQSTEFVNRVSAVRVEPCDKKMDIVFVADASGSITAPNFLIMKGFLRNVVNRLTIHPNKTRVGLVRFSSSPSVQFYLDTYQSGTSVQGAIGRMNYTSGGTNTATAITTVSNAVFTALRGSREEAVKVMLLITDGRSSSRMATVAAAERVKEKGIIVFALGIANADYIELNAVASNPNCTHVFTINTFDELDSLLSEIHNSACRAPRKVVVNEGVANQTVEIPNNGTVEVTEEIEQKENGTSITTSVECGVVKVYISVNTPHPGPSLYDIEDTATGKMPSHVFVESTKDGRPLYITYVGKHLPDDITRCDNAKFTINYVDGKVPETQIKCIQNNVEKPCTGLDFANSQYSDLMCRNSGQDVTAPTNPCTEATLQAGIIYHPYPGDDTKFIKCDWNGGMYITMCPELQTYNDRIHICEAPQSGTHKANGTTPLEIGIANPCTFREVENHRFYFPHPDTHFFIQCDAFGGAWKVPCPSGLIWHSNNQTCLFGPGTGEGMTTQANAFQNPCTPEAIANGQFFHPLPGYPHRYIQCDVSGQYYEHECSPGTLFNSALGRCTHT